MRYYVNPETYIVRLGYRGFLSAIWMMWKMNRNARALAMTTKAEIIFPLPWLK